MKTTSLIPQEIIENKIFLIRGKKVMIDSDLAGLYGVTTKALNQAFKRNRGRFPDDFVFELSKIEKNYLVTNCDHLASLKFSYRLPNAFTEPGVAMLSSVLNSEKAVQVNIQIIRTFIKMREMIISNSGLRKKVEEMERKYDKKFAVVFQAIIKLMKEPNESGKKIGFQG
jgi:hypothetical protein